MVNIELVLLLFHSLIEITFDFKFEFISVCLLYKWRIENYTEFFTCNLILVQGGKWDQILCSFNVLSNVRKKFGFRLPPVPVHTRLRNWLKSHMTNEYSLILNILKQQVKKNPKILVFIMFNILWEQIFLASLTAMFWRHLLLKISNSFNEYIMQ